MTTSTAATFAFGSALDLSQSFWAVIAALIVTQSSIGGTLKAGLEQFIGSVFGAVWGAAITLAIPHESFAMRGLALVVAVAPLTVLTTFSPGFRIAPITAILVLLSSMGVTRGPLGFAVERLLEIGLGCAVGLAVSVVVAPAHAYDAVLRLAGQVAGKLADQLDVLANLRAIVPMGVLGHIAGTFWTVAQSRPEERVRLFQRADRILRRTGESVFLDVAMVIALVGFLGSVAYARYIQRGVSR